MPRRRPEIAVAQGLLTPEAMSYPVLAPHLELHPSRAEARTPVPEPAGRLDDAFRSLSPGEQRIVRALYDAQRRGGDAWPAWAPSGTRVRSLDEIARMDRGLAGWNQVFKQLKAEGLIAEQTLGHVVARWTGPSGRGGVTARLAAGLRVAPTPVPSRSA
jgi:hypothetical protein